MGGKALKAYHAELLSPNNAINLASYVASVATATSLTHEQGSGWPNIAHQEVEQAHG